MSTWAGPGRGRVRPWLWFLLGFFLVLWGGAASAAQAPPCPSGYHEEPNPNSGVSCQRAYGSSGWLGTYGPTPTAYYCSDTVLNARIEAMTAYLPTAEAAYATHSNCTGTKHCTNWRLGNTTTTPIVRYDSVVTATGAITTWEASYTAYQSQSSSNICVADPIECDTNDPQSPFVSFSNVGAEVPLSVCDNANGWLSNCTFIAKPGSTTCGPTVCGTVYTWTPETCSAGPTPTPDAEVPAPSSKCVTVGAAEYCHDSAQDSQCGWINGQPICLGATPKGGCQEAGGGVLCDPAAATPPAPDNGTPGVKATEDGEVKAESGTPGTINNYDYFTSTTVNNSSVTVSTGNPTQSGDFDGDGFTSPDQAEEYGDFQGPENPFSEFGDGTGIWGESAWDIGERSGSLQSFLAGTFPFSLLAAGPLTMSYGGTTPTVAITLAGHTASSSMSMWSDLFALFRACMAVLLLWGFWLVMIETVKGWAH